MPRTTDRRHQQGELSKQRILSATLEIAAERGYDGTSVALVTERTGLAASSIYWHFGSKDELLAAALEYSYERWREVGPPWRAELPDTPLAETLHQRIEHAATAFVLQPEFWRLGLMLALERRLKEPAARRRYLEVRANTLDNLTDWYTRIIEREGRDVDAAPRLLASFHHAVMDGLFVAARTNPGLDSTWIVKAVAAGLATAISRLPERS